jgi:hypothetical protein
MISTTADALWTAEDVAGYLRVPIDTLYQWRKRNYGPPAAKVGKHLRYDPETVRAWFSTQMAA